MESHYPSATVPLKLYSAWYCPFAQRAWMALLHKGLAFEYVEVDPYRESQWWLKISRNRSQVPVIVAPASNAAGSTTIIDSTRIVEYLEDLEPHVNPLFPGDPNEKAEHRYWIDHINERVVPHVYRYLAAREPGEHQDDARLQLIEGLRELSDAMSPAGPFFSGPNLSAADLLLIPFAFRIDALLSHYRGFSLPTIGSNWSRYQYWYESMCSADIFQDTYSNHEGYRQRLIEHYSPTARITGRKPSQKFLGKVRKANRKENENHLY